MLYTQLLRDAVRDALTGLPSGSVGLASAVDRVAALETSFFSERFLIARPLFAAMPRERPVVLLIDEVDRADPEFEALLLEVLADSTRSRSPSSAPSARSHLPLVVLTTNATRELTEALRRRCLHAAVGYPEPSRERAIVKGRVPGIADALAERLVEFVQRLRALELRKPPSISESIEWARALVVLGASAIDEQLARDTLGVVLKHVEDREKVEPKLGALLSSPHR